MTVKAIIFDLDGTIIDTESPDFWSWEALYKEYGVPLTADLWERRTGSVDLSGFNPAHHLEQLTGIKIEPAALETQVKAYMEGCENQPILPGVLEIIQQARQQGIKLGIASNSDRPWVERWLKHHALDHYFDCVMTRDDVKEPKPAPELYLKAAAGLNVAIDECIAIEDSPVGMQAVLAAGIRCIAVPNWVTTNYPRPEGIALILTSLSDIDLPTLLARF